MTTHGTADLDESVRGRVMALWIMGFGGTVPIGLLVGGVIADRTSVTVVLLIGAVVAVLLALVTDVRPQSSESEGTRSTSGSGASAGRL